MTRRVSWYIGMMSDGLGPGWDLFGPPQMIGVGGSSAFGTLCASDFFLL